MKNCEQSKGQSIYDHGISVQKYVSDLITFLKTNQTNKTWRLPSWIGIYKNQILENLLPSEILSRYAILHDCGKPFCLEVDADGLRHFPNHAQKSSETYLKLSETPSCDDIVIAELIARDMEIHTIKAEDIATFCRNKNIAISLLITGLSETHSNAEMFGGEKGIESTSFKIKWKQIDKRGNAICKTLFGQIK